MSFSDFLEATLFTFGDITITTGAMLRLVFLLIMLLLIHRLMLSRVLPSILQKNKSDLKWKKKVNRNVNVVFFFFLALSFIYALNLDYTLWTGDSFVIRISTVIQILLVFQFARIVDWITSRFLLDSISAKQSIDNSNAKKGAKRQGSRTVQRFVYLTAIILLIRNFGLDFVVIPIAKEDVSDITFTGILYFILIFLIARLLIWILVNIVLFNYYRAQGIEAGRQYAANQLFSYIAYTIAIIIGIQSLGVNMTILLGGAAALLVGVGLGLQQTFNDFFSGIILLFERTVEVGDVLNVEGEVGIVRKIGLRASTVETADHVSLIIPNSTLVSNKVTNWNHEDEKVRFKVSVGVAYGTDTDKVKALLIDIGKRNFNVLNYPPPLIRFTDFGDNALQFEMLFWTYSLINIEDLKSDLRFEINRVFRAEKISIPFPQRTIWMEDKDA